MESYLIVAGAGLVLAGISYGLLKREQRRSTERVILLARLFKYATEKTGGRAAGYYPGSLADPRD